MDPVEIAELVCYDRYAVADVPEAARVSFERHTIQGLGAQL
jgi:hypothetical protein